MYLCFLFYLCCQITKDQRAEFEAKQAEERAAMEVKQTKAMERIREAEAKMASEVLEREEKIRNCELEKAKLESRTDELEKQLQSVNATAEEHKVRLWTFVVVTVNPPLALAVGVVRFQL